MYFRRWNSRNDPDRRPLPTSAANGHEPISNIAIIASGRVTGYLVSAATFCWAPWLVQELPCICIMTSESDVSDQNVVILAIFQGRLAMFMEYNSISKRGVNMMKDMCI